MSGLVWSALVCICVFHSHGSVNVADASSTRGRIFVSSSCRSCTDGIAWRIESYELVLLEPPSQSDQSGLLSTEQFTVSIQHAIAEFSNVYVSIVKPENSWSMRHAISDRPAVASRYRDAPSVESELESHASGTVPLNLSFQQVGLVFGRS